MTELMTSLLFLLLLAAGLLVGTGAVRRWVGSDGYGRHDTASADPVADWAAPDLPSHPYALS